MFKLFDWPETMSGSPQCYVQNKQPRIYANYSRGYLSAFGVGRPWLTEYNVMIIIVAKCYHDRTVKLSSRSLYQKDKLVPVVYKQMDLVGLDE